MDKWRNEMNHETQELAQKYRYYAVIDHFDEIVSDPSLKNAIDKVLKWEKEARERRQLESRVRGSRLRRYPPETPLSDFDWSWPDRIETREDLDNVFRLEFIKEKENLILMGPSGIGKTTLLKNIVRSASESGKRAVFIESGELLLELQDAQKNDSLRRAIEKYAKPELLAIDEIGYLSYEQRHADLLFQLISRRHGRSSTALTTNLPFKDWDTIFPNATSLSALIDRLIESCTVVRFEGSTYRGKLYQDKATRRKKARLKPVKK